MRAFAVLVVLVGCGGKGDPKVHEAPKITVEPLKPRDVPPAPPPDDPCSADSLSLGKATALTSWKPPDGCTAMLSSGTAISRTEAELAAHLECTGGVKHGVDLAKSAVLQITDSMSPATVGWYAYDDGNVITLITKFRSPCPTDPRPMPMTQTRWYLMPAAGTRTLAHSTCTIRPKCPT